MIEFTTLLHTLSGPLVGGLIGYITNYIAIKMLFRPTKPVYIGSFHLPFTPGIVPRRKDDLADILGSAIVAKFWNADDLEIVFTSDALGDAFADSFCDLIYSKELTFASLRRNWALDADNDNNGGGSDAPGTDVMGKIKEELCVHLLAGILKTDLPEVIASEGARLIGQHLPRPLNGRLGDELVSGICKPLAQGIEGYVLEHGRELVMPLIDEELGALSHEPLANLTAELFADPDETRRSARALYDGFMRAYVRPIVESIDVGGMITDKIRRMSAPEVEKLVHAVVKKELRYVIWLGALLGIVIGTVNIFI